MALKAIHLNRGWGDNRAATELSFGHVTTKTWVCSGVFEFFGNFFLSQNMSLPPKYIFENKMGNQFFGEPFFFGQRAPFFNSNYIKVPQSNLIALVKFKFGRRFVVGFFPIPLSHATKKLDTFFTIVCRTESLRQTKFLFVVLSHYYKQKLCLSH